MGKEYKSEDALAVNLWVLRVTGAWPADIRHPVLRLLYKLYGCITVSFFTAAYFSTEVVYVALIFGDLDAMIDSYLLLLTHIGNAVKLANFLMRRKRVERLFLHLNRSMFQPRRPEHRVMLESAIGAASRDSKIFLTICIMTVLGWAIVPLVDNTETNKLPLKTWFPFDTTVSPTYQFIYLYEILSVMMNASMNSMMDMIPSGLMALIGGQVDILKYDLRYLREDALAALTTEQGSAIGRMNDDAKLIIKDEQDGDDTPRSPRDQSGYKKERDANRGMRKEPRSFEGVVDLATNSQELDEVLNRRVAECIEHHVAIMKCAREVQRVFDIGILVQFWVSSIILCLTCFELTLTPVRSIQFLSLLLYQACMLFEIYCYCWYGNEVIVKTNELPDAVYGCEWTTSSSKFKTSLRIMICCMQRPLKLTVGNFFDLSLGTFSAILQSAYSFYTLLQRVHNRGY